MTPTTTMAADIRPPSHSAARSRPISIPLHTLTHDDRPCAQPSAASYAQRHRIGIFSSPVSVHSASHIACFSFPISRTVTWKWQMTRRGLLGSCARFEDGSLATPPPPTLHTLPFFPPCRSFLPLPTTSQTCCTVVSVSEPPDVINIHNSFAQWDCVNFVGWKTTCRSSHRKGCTPWQRS